MSTSQTNLLRPADARPHCGYPLPRIDVANKFERGKHLNFKEKSDFGVVCGLGADQLVDCYGKTLMPGHYYNVFDFVSMCDECPYANKHIDREDLMFVNDIHSIFSGRYIYHRIHDCIEEEKPRAFVYFIADGRFVKIGKATDVLKRLSALQTSNSSELSLACKIPCKNTENATEAESRLHIIYRDYRVRGEWFDLLPYITKRNGVVEWFRGFCDE